jgi:hypothetical protein
VTPPEQEPHADPGGVQAAIDRYRDLAKYLVGIFAAIGGLLIAGTQLSSLGKLSWDDHAARLLVAVAALALSVLAVVVIVGRAVSILRPIEMTLEDVIADPERLAAANRRTWLFSGLDNVTDVGLLPRLSRADVSEARQQVVQAVISDVVIDASYREASRRFDKAAKPMLAWAVVGACAIALFAWAANPPDGEAKDKPLVKPTPQRVTFTLTDAGRQTLSDALGATCVSGPIAALAIGGTSEAPLVVTLPQGGCKPVQFTLSSDLGVALPTK